MTREDTEDALIILGLAVGSFSAWAPSWYEMKSWNADECAQQEGKTRMGVAAAALLTVGAGFMLSRSSPSDTAVGLAVILALAFSMLAEYSMHADPS